MEMWQSAERYYFTLGAEATNPDVYNVIAQEFFRFKGSFDAGTRFRLVTTRGLKEAVMTARTALKLTLCFTRP